MFPSLAMLLSFSLGLIAVANLPSLPSPFQLVLVFLAGLLLLTLRLFRFPAVVVRPFVVLGCFLLGAAWAIAWGQKALENELPLALEQQLITMEGEVVGLPQADEQKTRFELVPRLFIDLPLGLEKSPALPERLQLSWYWREAQAQVIRPGDRWELKVKLKRPRGFVNFDGFDYQAWLLRRGIGASGYVVEGKLLPESASLSWATGISRWRYQLREWLEASSRSSQKAILIALLIGDSSQVEPKDWQRMLSTGTNHLIAISGLHVGFVALMGHLMGLWLGRAIHLLWRRLPAQIYAYIAALGCAAVYSALAGFSIPTQRSLIMIGVYYLACLMRVHLAASYLWALALALVLMGDPLASFDLGFWLSFTAVGLLLMAFSGRQAPATVSTSRVSRYLTDFARSQWVMFIGLLLPLLLSVHSLPLLAPLANFVAIPLVTFCVVPVLLVSALMSPWLGDLANTGLALAGLTLEFLARILDGLRQLAQGWANPVIGLSWAQALVMGLGLGALLLPRGLIPRIWAWLGLGAGLILTQLPQLRPPLALEVLDVGQGTSVIVTTAQHQLVYDTGPAYSESFDAGSGILVPRLQTQGIRQLDALVLSHWDMDHAGGLASLARAINTRHFYWGERSRTGRYPPALPAPELCHGAADWQWDGVNFRFLTWPIPVSAPANNHSCVLLISFQGQQILLAGDIEAPVEQALLRGNRLPDHLDWLLAPHHGSTTSSSPAFVAYTQPKWVVYSSGYKNRFGHPKAQVRARYQRQGSQELNTALSGAVRFVWDAQGVLQARAARADKLRYWFDQVVDY